MNSISGSATPRNSEEERKIRQHSQGILKTPEASPRAFNQKLQIVQSIVERLKKADKTSSDFDHTVLSQHCRNFEALIDVTQANNFENIKAVNKVFKSFSELVSKKKPAKLVLKQLSLIQESLEKLSN